ncbi:sigma-70 family RNA polymerase sigma factor [Aeoliella sp.]|uniref:sigma-70 family RNA polymerase sigma factor n=1 Tax=Aeoliella sp. TaxID=2795800 RepID=UPI003CCBDB06
MPASSELIPWSADPEQAAAAIYHRYGRRLQALVRNRLGPKLRRRIDADDVTQSTFRSFFLRAQAGEYQLGTPGDLWRLLASMATNKTRKQLERHRAARRDVYREQQASSSLLVCSPHTRTASEEVQAQEHLQLAVEKFNAEQRAVLEHALDGWSNGRIAAALGKSERTVRRILLHLREVLQMSGIASTPTDPRDLSPTPLAYGDYVLEKLVGAGGMGKVFRARVKQTGETVALKALHKSRQTDHRAVERFVQEAQILEQLTHPNIVGVRGLGRFPSGGHFMVLEHVAGGDLQSRLASGPLSQRIALDLFRQIVEATAHAHRHGIVHCDLKPANVLVTSNGRALVTDFGFAYLLHAAAKTPASLGGTLGFLAPELLRPGTAPTPTADVYSLGKLLQCMLKGDASLQGVIRRCVADDPARRYADASRLLIDLRQSFS